MKGLMRLPGRWGGAWGRASERDMPEADVCLILEGTYPYVRGGVSTWVHDLISGLPEVSFALLHVGARRDAARARKYTLPKNVVEFAEVYVHETVEDHGPRCPFAAKMRSFDTVRAFHKADKVGRLRLAAEVLGAFADPKTRTLSVEDALSSEAAWQLVLERYGERAPGTSFVDYFWTWRAVHAPLLQTLIAETPLARSYHAVSTGYAGLLGVVAKIRTGRPLILTEHGIYVRERMLDITRADWIWEEPVELRLAEPRSNPLKRMWVDLFSSIGEMTYDAADEVITLFGANMDIQRRLGADPRKTRVIPNGVRTDVFGPLAARRVAPGRRPLRIGFIGRVVPIKDVKTLLRAFAAVERELSAVELWIVGPTDEDESYAAECRELVTHLGLRGVCFTGHRDVREIYPEVDVLVLSSVSEGQPLSILEAAAAGVPSVATDVGACRELLEGGSPEDRALGPGGLVVPAGAPAELARALVTLLSDGALRARMAQAGRTRVERHYRQDQVISRYREIYGRLCRARAEEAAWPASVSS